MSIIILLILISLSIAIIFLLIFYWSMKSGQYDDTYTPSVRMLFEEKSKKSSNQKLNKKQGVTK
ncbi:MAG: cbb3-type cytochrome oxidase assembly protein CcoS [Cyclobacteriaceae bacterium]|nr:cbb3-type cytochrome oxidase assembly protein CcoS [Cyclobacteriaceae bacterium]MBX2955034.1 cbb3-type cytochrome oxidase assembly protein CcoS [Cyclobacteriaceae bacterium]